MKNKIYFTLILLYSISLKTNAQTNPSAFDLNTGSYSMTSWDSLAAAGTYPSSMVFHYINNPAQVGFDSLAVGNADWECVYNRPTRNRMLGLDADGFAFNATSSAQYNNCLDSTGGADATRFVGAAVLALNTTNRMNIEVTWTGGTVIAGDGNGTATNPRVFVIRLQYRIGTTGSFTDVPGPVQYISSQTAGDAQIVGPTMLPVSCENIPNVQVRWIYFQIAQGNGGTRPRMRVDEINVSSALIQGIADHNIKNTHVSIYPNPASASINVLTDKTGRKEIRIYNSIGSVVAELSSFQNQVVINRKNLPDGFYVVEVFDENSLSISKSKLVLNTTN